MIVVLSGGVGGARLCAGLVQVLTPEEVLVVVNTGDDFDHWGLRICPDLDTVMYTLSRRVDESQGWGIAGDTWNALTSMGRLGGESWFRLGDHDLATHLKRTAGLAAGRSLSEVTRELFLAHGLAHPVVPVTDAPHRTQVQTDRGLLDFQDYFVRQRGEPPCLGVSFGDGEPPEPSKALAMAMKRDDIEAVLVCPSNPVLSIQPLLAVRGVREWLRARRFPVLAVSPFIGGTAVKGPAARIFSHLGLEPTVTGLCDWYGPLVDGWLVDPQDFGLPVPPGVSLRSHHIRLDTALRRREVAEALLAWLSDIRAGHAPVSFSSSFKG
ncbi:MAG: 2-phospho-L-lactate transferase [Hydrogenophaga sp.]|uniref:2-phospho-L-lactate transferase n=1 Tax=Hydrogenophaga sp. TaxID=1904254 RepID=UPI002628501E|nr:2-phospho-L-lactate transferase [Hydrogenophaga sp.]MCW5668699.1 2-phospho-L-lactate transferase [Hydrogenophaga sp.]